MPKSQKEGCLPYPFGKSGKGRVEKSQRNGLLTFFPFLLVLPTSFCKCDFWNSVGRSPPHQPGPTTETLIRTSMILDSVSDSFPKSPRSRGFGIIFLVEQPGILARPLTDEAHFLHCPGYMIKNLERLSLTWRSSILSVSRTLLFPPCSDSGRQQ